MNYVKDKFGNGKKADDSTVQQSVQSEDAKNGAKKSQARESKVQDGLELNSGGDAQPPCLEFPTQQQRNQEQQAEKSLSTVAAKSPSEDTTSSHQGLEHSGGDAQPPCLELPPQQQRNQVADCLNEVRAIRDEMGTLRDGIGAIQATFGTLQHRVDAVERKLLAISSGSGEGEKWAPNRAASAAPESSTPLTASSNNETQQQQQRQSNTASTAPIVLLHEQQQPQPYEHLLKKVACESFTCVGAANFRRFVERSTVLADRTGFVREVLDMNVRRLLLVLPRGVGKTMALSCLAEFLAQPQEPDYKEGRECSRALFLTKFQNGRQFKIATADPDFFEQHIAAHPVLFFSLSGVHVSNAAELEYALGERIKEQFELNVELLMSHLEQRTQIDRVAKRQMDEFDGFLKAKKIAALDWGTAITFIVNLLEEQQRSTSAGRQNNETFIIVDDFDAPITQMAATKRGELAKQMDVMATFLNAICSTSARVVCAGTLRFVASGFKKWTVIETGSNRNARILRHFGFTRDEFNEMCRAYEVGMGRRECNLDDLFKFYKGHRVCSTQLCSTWSLIQYVTNVSGFVAEDTQQHLSPASKIAAVPGTSSAKDFSVSNASKKSSASTASLMRKFPSFHQDTGLFEQLAQLFSCDAIAAVVKDQLLTGTGYPSYEALDSHQLENLLQMAQGNRKWLKQKPLDDRVVSAFMEVLLSSGYLVHKRHHLRIPNAEIRVQIMEYLYAYHFEWSAECLEQTFVAAEALYALLCANDHEDDVQQQQKTESLGQEVSNLVATTTKQRVSRNERHIHTLFEMSLYAASEHTWVKVDNNDASVKSHNNKRPDLTVTWRNDAHHFGLMVEFKFNKSVKEAFAQIVENNYITQSHLFSDRSPPINTLLALTVVHNEKKTTKDTPFDTISLDEQTPNDVVEVRSRRWKRIDQESTVEFLERCEAALAHEA